MKIDLMGVMQLVGIAMTAVQKIKAATGKDKEAAVIDTVQELLPSLEGVVGLDFVNDAALHDLLASYIAARKALAAGILAARALKPIVPPAT